MTRLGRWTGWALLLLGGVSALAAQVPSTPGKEVRRSTTVTADHLEVNRKTHRAIYTGNVIAKTTDLTVTSNRMEFDFDDKMEVVNRMVAVGHVRISRSDGTEAAAEKATYHVLQEEIVLEGHAQAWHRGNSVSGTRITLFLNEDRQIVEGDEGERVTAIIYPKERSGQER